VIQVDLNKVKLLKRSHNQASNTIDSNTVTTKLLSFFFFPLILFVFFS